MMPLRVIPARAEVLICRAGSGLRQTAISLALLGAFLLCGCGPKTAVIDRTLSGGIFWPGGGTEDAVIQYEWSLQNLEVPENGWSFINFITGRDKAVWADPRKSRILVRPFGIFVDANKRMYVTDPGAKRVSVIDLISLEAFSFYKLDKKRLLKEPLGVVADAHGSIYVSDATLRKVFIFDEKGRYVSEMPADFGRPTGLAIDEKNDRLYISDTAAHTVNIFHMDMSPAGSIGGRGTDEGQFKFTTHLFVDANGNLYVTDAINFRIQIFDSSGRFLDKFGQLGDLYGDLDKPKGVAVDNQGHIYVVDSIKDMIKIYNREGKLLLFFGSKGHRLGEFWLPTGIFIDPDNEIYVTDTFNMRVSAFRFLEEGREP